MRNIPAALQAHLELEVTSLTRCLKITKTNGDILRITEHDVDVVVSGDTYFSGVPFDSSAIQSTDTLAVDNAEITLGFTDDLVIKDDFDDGLFDEAAFELFVLNWEDPTDGIAYLKRGTLGAITFNDETSVTVQLRGLTQALQKPVVEKYSPTCRVNLGGLKCGVVNVPTRIRRNRQKVKTWDWFLVPNANITTPVVSNLSFNTNLNDWTVPSGSDWDRDNAFTAGEGTHYVVGGAPGGLTSDSGYEMQFYRDLATLADLGMSDADVDDGDYSIDFASLMALASSTQLNPGKVFVEQFDSLGRTLKRTESAYVVPEYQVWQGVGVTEFVLPTCRTIRFGLMNRIDHGTAGFVAFDDLAIRHWTNVIGTFGSKVFRTTRIPSYDIAESFQPTNPSFETNAPVANGINAVTGWTHGTGNFFQVVASTGAFTPYAGGFMLKGGDNSSGNPDQVYAITQTIDLVNFGDHEPTDQNITDGWYYYEFRVKWGKQDTSDPRATVEFLTAASAVISTLDTGYDTASPLDVWVPQVLAGRVPSTAAKVRITLYARSGAASSAANVVFDAVESFLLVTAYENENDEEYGALANAPPTYDYDLQDYTVDGEVIVQTRTPVFAYSTVTDTVDERTFEATGISNTASMLYSGKLVWLSGANAGKTSFIRIWDDTTKLAKLYNPLRGDIAIGDKFVYAIGCDKTVGRCADTFGNTHNMRAEPYLPGPNRVIEFMTAN